MHVLVLTIEWPYYVHGTNTIIQSHSFTVSSFEARNSSNTLFNNSVRTSQWTLAFSFINTNQYYRYKYSTFIVTAIRPNPQNDRLWLGWSLACNRGDPCSIPGQYTSEFIVQNVALGQVHPFPLVLRFSPVSVIILSMLHIFPIIHHWYYFVSLCVCVCGLWLYILYASV